MHSRIFSDHTEKLWGDDTPHTCNFSFTDSTCLQPSSGNTNLCDPLAFSTYSPNLSDETSWFCQDLRPLKPWVLPSVQGSGALPHPVAHLIPIPSVGAGQGPALHRPRVGLSPRKALPLLQQAQEANPAMWLSSGAILQGVGIHQYIKIKMVLHFVIKYCLLIYTYMSVHFWFFLTALVILFSCLFCSSH